MQVHLHIHVQFSTQIPSLAGGSSSALTLHTQQGQAWAVLLFQVTWESTGVGPKDIQVTSTAYLCT